jgi:hypothetical protein
MTSTERSYGCAVTAHHAATRLHPLIAERLTEATLHGPGHYIEQDPASRCERTMTP